LDIIVQKYGGTSVGNIEKIKNVADKIIKTKNTGKSLIVVLSAMSGETNRLLGLAHQISKHPSDREMDMLVSTGEQVSTSLLAIALHEKGYGAISLNAHQVGIYTDKAFTKARITEIKSDKLIKHLNDDKIIIVTGFQGVDTEGNITTLGRGGSDTSAVAVAAAIKAEKCEIYTDVDGVYTTDPRIVKNAKKLKYITYDEMLELASLGAKVLMNRSVEFAKKFKVKLEVKSSYEDIEGTLIVEDNTKMENVVISGITQKKDEAKVTIHKVPDNTGVASKIFKQIGDKNINVNVIVQTSSVNDVTDISFTIPRINIEDVKNILENLKSDIKYKNYYIADDISIVSMVGIGMKSHAGIASSAFDILAKNEINIDMISTSEIKISVIVKEKDSEKSVQVLHEYFIK